MTDINQLVDSSAASHGDEAQWISLSDLMSSLMMIFMLIAIAFMLKTQADSQSIMRYSEQARLNAMKMQDYARKMEADAVKIKQVAQVYDKVKSELYSELKQEFEGDFNRWGATINKDLSIRFENQYILFNRGDTELKASFQEILANFFPRYMKIITSPKYKSSVQEIRIEGHTSSLWSANTSPQEAYFRNMELSQARTRSALRYVMGLSQVQAESAWLRKYVTANGLSSSQPILNPDGTENEVLSQRVEFRIRTDAESKINDILQSAAAPTDGADADLYNQVKPLFQ